MTPTTPTTPKSCCEKLFPMTGRHRPACHTDSTKNSEHVSYEGCLACEVEEQYTSMISPHTCPKKEKVHPCCWNPENHIIGLQCIFDEEPAPQHTSPEKDYSHYHCWGQPKTPACGKPSEAHDICCLCGIPKELSFTEKTLAEFRELIQGWQGTDGELVTDGEFFYSIEGFEQWLSSKLEGAYHSGRQDGFEHARESEESDEEIKKAERTRILTLIESKKNEVDHDQNQCGQDDICGLCAQLLALTSLAEELTNS